MTTLLDLVQQYSDMHASCVGLTAAGAMESARLHHAEAEALFARIAALVPQQPVQARSMRGLPLWHHGCGAIDDCADQPGSFACSTLGCTAPWRPLLVGGNPASGGDIAAELKALLDERAGRVHSDDGVVMATLREILARHAALLVGGNLAPKTSADAFLQARDEALRQRDVARDVVDDRCRLRTELDEARAEVERLTSRVRHLEVELAGTQQMLDAMTAQPDPLTAAGLEPCGQCDGSRIAIERLLEINRSKQKRIEELQAAQSDPLVLRLPEVPEGTSALVDRHKRHWTLSEYVTTEKHPLWQSESGTLRVYHALLAGSGPLTVELAPPREPRTAAEVWHGLASRQEQKIRQYAPELAEALDREAGL